MLEQTEPKKRGCPPGKQGPRPNTWKTGTDPVRHQQYNAFIQQRNQARWRGETWNLEFDQWVELWGDQWTNRGRSSENSCMTRSDDTQPWDANNAVVIRRSEHAHRSGAKSGTNAELKRREMESKNNK